MGLSEDEAQDPYYMKHMEIKYKDGSSYVVSDSEELIENSGYVLGLTGGVGACIIHITFQSFDFRFLFFCSKRIFILFKA